MKKLFLKLHLLLAFILLATLCIDIANARSEAHFPGKILYVESPNRRYQIIDTHSNNSDFHILRFKDKNQRVDSRILSALTETRIKQLLLSEEQIKKVKQELLKESNKSGIPFYAYGGRVGILWSPSSKFFAIDDYGASNNASAFLFNISDLSKSVDLSEKLQDSLRQSLPITDHLYFNVRKWINPTTLKMLVTGHNSVPFNEFTLFYQYDLNGSFHFVKRLKKECYECMF